VIHSADSLVPVLNKETTLPEPRKQTTCASGHCEVSEWESPALSTSLDAPHRYVASPFGGGSDFHRNPAERSGIPVDFFFRQSHTGFVPFDWIKSNPEPASQVFIRDLLDPG
jgi:hypothetical protein